jgi:hypothetical protein
MRREECGENERKQPDRKDERVRMEIFHPYFFLSCKEIP